MQHNPFKNYLKTHSIWEFMIQLLSIYPKIYLDNNKIHECILFFEKLTRENKTLPHHNKTLAEL